MTEQEAYGQAFENGRKVGDAEGYARGKAEAGKSGKWEEWSPSDITLILTGEEMLFGCSGCGAKYPDVEGYRYCPNCGARMEGDLP